MQLSVHAARAGTDAAGDQLVTATVDGVVKGGHAVLFAKAAGLRLRNGDAPGCKVSGYRLRCVVRSPSQTITFHVPAGGATTMSFTLLPPWNWTDTTPGDDTDSVEVPAP